MSTEGPVLALSGGVGGAKLAHGLSQVIPIGQLTIVCNSADDFDWFGLRVCPDFDSIAYALAGLDDRQRGWGRRNETWECLASLRTLADDVWFQIGDRDLAMHVWRTNLLRSGRTPTQIAVDTASRLGLSARIIPMSDDPVRTIVHTRHGALAFQDYFVREQCRPKVLEFEYTGAASARASAAADLLTPNDSLRAVILCPSNPWLSIDPILAIPGWQSALQVTHAPVLAISPIISARAIKGPAAKIMAELGMEVSPLGIARHYRGLIDGLLIDLDDADYVPRIEALGIQCRAVSSVMHSDSDRTALAAETLRFAEELAVA